MFKKLRIKLTLINILVTGLILGFVFLSIYLLMNKALMMDAERAINFIAMQNKGPERPNPHIVRRMAQNSFTLTLDSHGEVIFKSQSMEVENKETLINKIEKFKKDKGNIKIEGETYRYKKFVSMNDEYVTLAFLNIQNERDFLAHLAMVFIVIGIISIFLTFSGSLFLADKALVPIKDAWEKQKNFIADASHELRTPLSSIQTNLEVLSDNFGKGVKSQKKWLDNIQSESKRMTRLVDDLLILARVDSRQEYMNKTLFKLDEAMKRAIAPFAPIAEKKGIKTSVNIDKEVEFTGDESRIKQLIVILLDNAIKYSGESCSVEINLEDYLNNIIITVKDTGEGISDEDKVKIFERFYTVDKARSRESGGFGLGLSIAKWIVTEHGGSINVYDNELKGTTFKIFLPKYHN